MEVVPLLELFEKPELRAFHKCQFRFGACGRLVIIFPYSSGRLRSMCSEDWAVSGFAFMVVHSCHAFYVGDFTVATVGECPSPVGSADDGGSDSHDSYHQSVLHQLFRHDFRNFRGIGMEGHFRAH